MLAGCFVQVYRSALSKLLARLGSSTLSWNSWPDLMFSFWCNLPANPGKRCHFINCRYGSVDSCLTNNHPEKSQRILRGKLLFVICWQVEKSIGQWAKHPPQTEKVPAWVDLYYIYTDIPDYILSHLLKVLSRCKCKPKKCWSLCKDMVSSPWHNQRRQVCDFGPGLRMVLEFRGLHHFWKDRGQTIHTHCKGL